MLLHIGNDVMIPISDIVFILDINTCKKSKTNLSFIDRAFSAEFQKKEAHENSKSLIVIIKDEKTLLYYSPISSVTLKKRADHFLNDYTLA